MAEETETTEEAPSTDAAADPDISGATDAPDAVDAAESPDTAQDLDAKPDADLEPQPSAQPAASKSRPGLDPRLLSRMIGELGSPDVVEKFSMDMAAAYTAFLPAAFRAETGYDVEITFAGCTSGLKEELVAGLGDLVGLSDASLRNWCPSFTIACGSTFVMTLVEALMGAEPETITPPKPRTLSKIELDLAEMVFGKIAGVLRSAIPAAGSNDATLSKPYNAPERPKTPEGYQDPNATLISMNIQLGKTQAQFHIIVPQRDLLKTIFSLPKSSGGGKVKKEWSDQIKEQVQRSQVAVEARIKLQSLKLETLSKLQVGDVIPFDALTDVRVEINANGKELYFGEFGRSGSKYTVRVSDTYTTETDLLTHLMG